MQTKAGKSKIRPSDGASMRRASVNGNQGAILSFLHPFTTVRKVLGVLIIIGTPAHAIIRAFANTEPILATILLGLEFQVAADIIGAVAVAPIFQALDARIDYPHSHFLELLA